MYSSTVLKVARADALLVVDFLGMGRRATDRELQRPFLEIKTHSRIFSALLRFLGFSSSLQSPMTASKAAETQRG